MRVIREYVTFGKFNEGMEHFRLWESIKKSINKFTMKATSQWMYVDIA